MYQNLFEALQNVCGFTALESDMFQIINAYEKDKAVNADTKDYKEKYEKCIRVIKKFDAGIIGMYDL